MSDSCIIMTADGTRSPQRDKGKRLPTGLRSDTDIRLCGPKTAKRYPDRLRRIHYCAEDFDTRFVFLANNTTLPALTIAIVRKELAIGRSMAEIPQMLSISLFEKTPILQAFSNDDVETNIHCGHNQLFLFDF